MTPFDRHLQAARGYLDLGMPLEAHEEIEDLEPEMRTLTEVLILGVEIFQVLEKWDLMQAIAAELCRRQPDDPDWFLKFSYAIRRAVGVQEALTVLATVANRFTQNTQVVPTL